MNVEHTVIGRFTLPSIAGPKMRESMRAAAQSFARSIGKSGASVRAEVTLTGGLEGIRVGREHSTVNVRVQLFGVRSSGDEHLIRTTNRLLVISRDE